MLKYLFKRDTILATIMVFVVMGMLALIPINTHVLDPIKLALQDFDYNDMAYSQFNKNSHTAVDTGIVIINIGEANRTEIAAIIEKAAAENPIVTGVDVLFNEPKEAQVDSILQQLFSSSNKIVLAYNLLAEKGTMETTGFLYEQSRQKGYANFVGEEGGSIRHTAPFIKGEKELYFSFAATITQTAYPDAYEKLKSRDKLTEQINYTRVPEKYLVIEGKDFLQNRESMVSLTNKVVLLGYVSNNPNNIEDKHFTPFNKKSVGKTIPDMEGIFIHANIISMMRDGDYIKKSPVWINWFIASLLCWLHMSLFIRYFIDKHLWFHLVAKMAQLFSAVLFVYLGLLFYYKWDLKINLTPTFVAIILAVDVLYFYEAIIKWLHKRLGIYSIFINTHH
jgi:CHASE2 domain-containing sensor protein